MQIPIYYRHGVETITILRAASTTRPTATKKLLKLPYEGFKSCPICTLAANAFVLVIKLDLSRRENDRKVLYVKMQMQELMAVFFELRHFRNSKECGQDGLSIAERLEGLMVMIADDVTHCGSACDVYMKKGLIRKTLTASSYENRLADYTLRFREHRKKLHLAFAAHASIGIDIANRQLLIQSERLQNLEEKLDEILNHFRKLDTPREREVHRFIEENGGAKACLKDDELLEALISKSGEPSSRISGREDGRRTSSDLPSIRKKLLKELMEDVDEVLDRNLKLYERKLDMQSKQLTETIEAESEHIIQTLLSGAHDRIIDPDLRTLWKDMAWKGSVKARHFVLNLHDFYTDKLINMTSDSTSQDGGSPVNVASPIRSPRHPPRSASSGMFRRQDDRWALSYINATYVQPILEAIDDDATGFISIKEVNTFVSSRPEGWSLPQWIAYWAVGWQVSVSAYKSKIYSLVHAMLQTLEHVLPSNRRTVDEYLFHPSFWRLELLLRSTRSANPKVREDPDLARITEAFAVAEEERLEMNLENVGYELDTSATVALVTGEGRIERYAFPLIYLLLRRHLRIITVACKHVLDTDEMAALSESLVSVLLCIDDRIKSLEAILKQTNMDMQSHFGNFAFGMLSYGDIKRSPIQNSFGSWVDEDEDKILSKEGISSEIIKKKASAIPHSILKYRIQDGFQCTNYQEYEPAALQKSDHPMQGTWTGQMSRTEGEQIITYIIRVSFKISPGANNLIGKGEDFSTAFDLEGCASQTQTGYEFEFAHIDDKDELVKTASGTFDPVKDILVLSWSDRRKKENPDDPFYQPVELHRTPPSLVRYWYTADRFLEDPVGSRWSFACKAVYHLAQEKLWSRSFFQERFQERRRFVELSTRALIVSIGLTPQHPLNLAESGELESLRRRLNPSEARFYQALSEFEIQKLPWHPAWGCDSCGRRITKSRILCLQCMSGDLSDNIDLCASCVNEAPAKRNFKHDPTHDILKVEETLHDYHLAHVIGKSRSTLNHAKSLFRALESSTHTSSEGPQLDNYDTAKRPAETVEPLCASCNARVSTPCWVCVVCTKDTYVCDACDVNKLSASIRGPSPHHRRNHPLVRLRDCAVAGQRATTEERLAALQQRITNMENKMITELVIIEAETKEQLSNMERRLKERMAVFEAGATLRFDRMEAMMRQLIAQTSALPSIYAQSVKDQMRVSLPASPEHSPRWF
ncbi:hypothetical protein CPC08DRAFT_736574 [Agrocybe pediades]|nr:hypothetical protein CPC08DRAFT_736574 [Agrocybe pediades]